MLQVRFSGTREILYNLGNVLNAAQRRASGDQNGNLAAARAYMDAATHDRRFLRFIDNFRSHIGKPTGSLLKSNNSILSADGRNLTLPQIANLTSRFGGDHLDIRAKAYRTFGLLLQETGLCQGEKIPTFRAFLDAIKPSLSPAEQTGNPQKARRFTRKMLQIDTEINHAIQSHQDFLRARMTETVG